MSDENLNGKQGRWNHLLRELSPSPLTPHVKKAPRPSPQGFTPQGVKPHGTQTHGVQPHEIKQHEIKAHELEDHGLKATEGENPSEENQEPVYSISSLNKAIKEQLEGEFPQLWVRGEISNFKAHSSGHHYFSLKDDKAQIAAVMFRGFNSRLKFKPETGMEVLVRGKITLYEPRGNYQLFCETMEPVGAGALQRAFEQLKQKLEREGLFDESHKQEIPAFPKEVGVITSPTGAAIQDILNVLGRRSKRARITVIPVRVQGEEAAQEIVQGIELANQAGLFDVLIVGRGGGSIEDLWGFNEEKVARAIFKSRLPIISSVGHEIDFTISDFVADRRAPTPSAAAEMVAKSEEELREQLKFLSKSLRLLMYQVLEKGKTLSLQLQKQLLDPRKYVHDSMMALEDRNQRLEQGIFRLLKNKKLETKALLQGLKNPTDIVLGEKKRNQMAFQLLKARMDQLFKQKRALFSQHTGLLDSLSPLKTVDRGYGIVRQEGRLIPNIKSLQKGRVEVELKDGYIEGEVKGLRPKEGKEGSVKNEF